MFVVYTYEDTIDSIEYTDKNLTLEQLILLIKKKEYMDKDSTITLKADFEPVVDDLETKISDTLIDVAGEVQVVYYPKEYTHALNFWMNIREHNLKDPNNIEGVVICNEALESIKETGNWNQKDKLLELIELCECFMATDANFSKSSDHIIELANSMDKISLETLFNYLFEVKKWWSSSEILQVTQDNKNSTHSSIYKKLIENKKV
jgi:hypothetical protein